MSRISYAMMEAGFIPGNLGAFKKEGGKIKLYDSGGGGGAPSQPEKTTQTTTTIPDYAKPYVERMLGKTEALGNAPYQAYGGERIAGFTPMQQKAFQGVQDLTTASQLGTATGLAKLAGQRAGALSYTPTSFANLYNAPGAYQTGQFSARNVTAPELQQFQMGPAERVGLERVGGPAAFTADVVKDYMNPYMQNVVDIQKREAQRQADISGATRSSQAAQAGALGGSRSAIQNAMADRETQRLMSDIQATGSSAAYQQALGQFNLQQQAEMQAALANQQAAQRAELANQQAGLTVGGQNLSALLGVQQLGSGQIMQAQLANQQAGLEAQRQRELSRQFGYGQAMTAAEARARFGTEAQRQAEQSRQFGAQYGLQGIQQQLAAAGQLGQLGQTQFAQQKDILQGQLAAGAQQRELEQQRLQQSYQDFINQRQYPYQQLAFMSDMLRGLPLAQYSQTMYQQPASIGAQIAGAGLGVLGARQAGLFGAEGGVVPGGLARVAADKLTQG